MHIVPPETKLICVCKMRVYIFWITLPFSSIAPWQRSTSFALFFYAFPPFQQTSFKVHFKATTEGAFSTDKEKMAEVRTELIDTYKYERENLSVGVLQTV